MLLMVRLNISRANETFCVKCKVTLGYRKKYMTRESIETIDKTWVEIQISHS